MTSSTAAGSWTDIAARRSCQSSRCTRNSVCSASINGVSRRRSSLQAEYSKAPGWCCLPRRSRLAQSRLPGHEAIRGGTLPRDGLSGDSSESPARARRTLLGQEEQAVPGLRVRDGPRVHIAGVKGVHSWRALCCGLSRHLSVSCRPSQARVGCRTRHPANQLLPGGTRQNHLRRSTGPGLDRCPGSRVTRERRRCATGRDRT